MRCSLIVAALLVPLSCASNPETRQAKPSPPPAPRVLWTVPLTYEAAGRTIPVPMVKARIHNVDTLLIVDSGASHHVLTKDFAEQAGLVLQPGEPGKDHSGAEVATWTLPSVDADLTGTGVPLTEVAAVQTIPPLKALGIGGFLSPQHLHAGAYAVLDFTRSDLQLVEGDAGLLGDWLQQQNPSLRALTLPRGNPDRKIFITAALLPGADALVELDSGGSGTEFLASYAGPAVETEQKSAGVGISGKEVLGSNGGARVVRVGGVEVAAPQVVLRQTMSQPDLKGLVGMDMLKSTVLAVTRSTKQPVLWLVPVAPSTK